MHFFNFVSCSGMVNILDHTIQSFLNVSFCWVYMEITSPELKGLDQLVQRTPLLQLFRYAALVKFTVLMSIKMSFFRSLLFHSRRVFQVILFWLPNNNAATFH